MRVSFLALVTVVVTDAFCPQPSTTNLHRVPNTALASTAEAKRTDFDLKSYFAERLPLVEKALDESLVSPEPQTDKIVESMKYSLMAGGKRIRPILCLAACDMFCPEEPDRAMPAAVAVEMIHTMSLIHDDLPSMDNDDLRRGKPTNHVRVVCDVVLWMMLDIVLIESCCCLSTEHAWLRDTFEKQVMEFSPCFFSFFLYFALFSCLPQVVYGEDVAILAGDALLSQSFQHVAEHVSKDVDPARVLDVVVRLGKSVGPKGLAGGQVMDLECEAKADSTLDDLRWIHTHKTATLLQVAVASGAILGGATPKEVQAIEDFALNIGLAFQVADDILDVTQSTEELGKTAGKDEDTDKTTYPKLMGLDGAREEAERLVALAKKSLAPFGEKATPLLALADFIIDRKN